MIPPEAEPLPTACLNRRTTRPTALKIGSILLPAAASLYLAVQNLVLAVGAEALGAALTTWYTMFRARVQEQRHYSHTD
jgi:hypothetical protein